MNRAEIMANLERKYNLPSGYLARTRQIESGGGVNVYNKNSGAAGEFQFIPSTAKTMGLKNPYDFESAADAAARLAVANRAQLVRSGIEEPTAAQLYLAHQQGAGGATKLLSGGDKPATSIVGKRAVIWNAGDEAVTGPGFAQQIMAKFEGTPLPKASEAPAQAPTGFGGQVANFLFGPPQPRSPDAFASDASPGLIAQATGGLIGGGRAEPFSVGFDTPRPYQPAFAAPEQQYGAAFAGSAPDMSGGSATLTSLPPTISAPAAGAAGIGSALASLGGALAKAGAAKEDMSWVQRPAETYRGKWDDEIFKRSIFGIRGLLG